VDDAEKLRSLKDKAKSTRYEDLTGEDAEAMRTQLENDRQHVALGMRSRPSAQGQDVRLTFDRCIKEVCAQFYLITCISPYVQLNNLAARCFSSAFLVIVPGATEVVYDPFVYSDKSSARFLEMVYGVHEDEFVARMAGFAVAGLRGTHVFVKRVTHAYVYG
jgi:hypothetical protein